MSSLQIQAKVIAVIEMVLAIFSLIFLGFVGILISTQKETILEGLQGHHEYPHLKELLESSALEQISLFLLPVLYFASEFVLGCFLYRSADKNQHKRLRIWFTITLTLTVVGGLAYLIEVMRNPDFTTTLAIFGVNCVFTLYSLLIVYLLISEIKRNGYQHPVPYNGYSYKI